MKETKIGYLVRFALSTGIKKVECYAYDGYSAGRYVKLVDSGTLLKVGSDFVFFRDEAVALAESMRNKRISSLKRQIARLESMNIEVPE